MKHPLGDTAMIRSFLIPLLISTSLPAELIYDPFAIGTNPAAGEYVDGGILKNVGPTLSGFTGNWTGGTDRWATSTAGLSYQSGNVSLGSLSSGTVIRRSDGGGTGANSTGRDLSSANSLNSPNTFWFATLFNPGSISSGEITELNFRIDDGGAAINMRMSGSDLLLEGSNQGNLQAGVTTMILGRVAVNTVSSDNGVLEDLDFWINPSDLSSVGALGAASYSVSGNYQDGQSYGPNDVAITMAGAVGSGNRVDEFVLTDSFSELQSVAYAIPEPGTLWLALLAGGSLFLLRRRR